jgi:predicted nicotinamide N-methyase
VQVNIAATGTNWSRRFFGNSYSENMKTPPSPSVTDQSIPGGWTERDFFLDDRQFRLLLPAQPDEFLEQLEEPTFDVRETDPYWAQLWPASFLLARLVYGSNWAKHARAIELGCGIGVVGLAALLAGLDVTFTDRVGLAVATAVENAHRNGFANARGFVLDWAQPPQVQFPLILACDVLYDRELHASLLRAIEALLADGGECWIGDPGRSATNAFLEQVAATEFRMRMLDQEGCETSSLKLGEFRLIVLRREFAVDNTDPIEI